MNDTAVNWISVGELADSFAPDSNALAIAADLVKQSIDLAFEDGAAVKLRFESESRLRWSHTGGERDGAQGEDDYRATSIRSGLYLVDYMEGGLRDGTSMSFVIDTDSKVATAIRGRLPAADAAHSSLLARALRQEELTAVEISFARASVGERFVAGSPHHKETDGLIGLRIRHRYSPNELYEHIYLNDKRYCWHCIDGSERGLADVDRCHYYAIRPNLYLFVWREKVVPTLGVVLLDLDALKTTGKICGYQDGAMTGLINFPMGAYSTIVNRTPGV